MDMALAAVPTMNLRFVTRDGRNILQQRWDGSKMIDGQWWTQSTWKDIEHGGEGKTGHTSGRLGEVLHEHDPGDR